MWAMVRQSVSLLLIAVQSLLASAFLHNQVPIGLQRHGGARGRVAPEVRRAPVAGADADRTDPKHTLAAQSTNGTSRAVVIGDVARHPVHERVV